GALLNLRPEIDAARSVAERNELAARGEADAVVGDENVVPGGGENPAAGVAADHAVADLGRGVDDHSPPAVGNGAAAGGVGPHVAADDAIVPRVQRDAVAGKAVHDQLANLQDSARGGIQTAARRQIRA